MKARFRLLSLALASPLVRLALASFVFGGLAFLVVGQTPSRFADVDAADADWRLGVAAVPAVEASQAVWQQPLWGSQPAELSTASTADPQPRLLGILGGNPPAQAEALFQMPSGERVRVRVGSTLPDGSTVTVVGATHAAWRDARGVEHEFRLLDAPRQDLP